MKRYWLFFVLFFRVSVLLLAQKGSTSNHPTWSAGLYGGVSFGYGFFTQPIKSGMDAPYTSFASTGSAGNLDAGITFRNRWGVRLLIAGFSGSNLTAQVEQSLATAYPGYIVTYLPSAGTRSHNIADNFSLGISYALPRHRWCFQPALLFGTTEVYSDNATALLKEMGTHRVVVLNYRPENASYRSPTLMVGGRAAWYAGRYFGLFAEAHFLTLWNNVQYRVDKKTLIEQIVVKEPIHLKRTAYGAAASIGIFLQIGRWEPKAKKQ